MVQVTHPLCDRNLIAARLDAVTEIAKCMGGCSASDSFNQVDEGSLKFAAVPSDISCVISSVLTTLGQSTDVQRGITRIFHKTATPSEVMKILLILLVVYVLYTYVFSHGLNQVIEQTCT